MGVENLVFKISDNLIYDPLTISNGVSKIITVANMGEDTLTDLGIYIKPATGLGELDYPSDNFPDTDYQDILTWGENTSNAVTPSGGITLTLTQNSGSFSDLITRTQGSLLTNKIELKDLAPNESTSITVLLENPASVTARRLYIDFVIE